MREKTSIFSGKHKAEGSWVKDLPKMVGRSIYERFLVCAKPKIRRTKGGDIFLSIQLGDRTGRLRFSIWRIPGAELQRTIALFKVGKIYVIEAMVDEYHNVTYLSVNWSILLRCFECQLDPDESKSDYFPEDFQMIRKDATIADPNEMLSFLFDVIGRIKHSGFSALLKALFADDFLRSFSKWPAAQKYHHNYYNGLLEHVCEMLRAADSFIVAYPNIDVDLLYAGIILHDVGKIEEYQLGIQIECDETAFLTGHMVIAVRMIDEAVRTHKIEISTGDLQRLYHLILSHHGDIELGYGSAVSPSLPEAIVLYHLDQLSAKVNAAYVRGQSTMTGARDSESSSPALREGRGSA